MTPANPTGAFAIGEYTTCSTEQWRHFLISDAIASAVSVSIVYCGSVKITAPAVPWESAIA